MLREIFDSLADRRRFVEAVATIHEIDPNLVDVIAICLNGESAIHLLLHPFDVAMKCVFAFILAREDPKSTPMLDERFMQAAVERFFGGEANGSVWEAARYDRQWTVCFARLRVSDPELASELRSMVRRERGLLFTDRAIVRVVLAFYFTILLDSVAAAEAVLGRYTFALKEVPDPDQSSS